jgi:hypothetical protein
MTCEANIYLLSLYLPAYASSRHGFPGIGLLAEGDVDKIIYPHTKACRALYYFNNASFFILILKMNNIW